MNLHDLTTKQLRQLCLFILRDKIERDKELITIDGEIMNENERVFPRYAASLRQNPKKFEKFRENIAFGAALLASGNDVIEETLKNDPQFIDKFFDKKKHTKK